MSILLFIVILLVLILVHEFGHFIVAKKSGIRVDEFGIGFPPKALTLGKKGETEYTLNWLPFGGFVRIFGESPNKESLYGPDKDRSMIAKPKIVQAAVLVAGVVMNVLLAWVLFSAMFMIGTDFAITREEVSDAKNVQLVISSVLEDSPAADVGIEPGDVITAMYVGDERVDPLYPQEATDFISEYSDAQIQLDVLRGEDSTTYTISPEAGLIEDNPTRRILGVSMGLAGFVQHLNPITALVEGGKFTLVMVQQVWFGLVDFFSGLFTFSANFEEVAGPIGIVGVVDQAAALGLSTLLFLTAVISINLAIINILPIPALDGGRLLFLVIEAIKGSPIRPEVANRFHATFFMLLILLILVISYFDIARLIG